MLGPFDPRLGNSGHGMGQSTRLLHGYDGQMGQNILSFRALSRTRLLAWRKSLILEGVGRILKRVPLQPTAAPKFTRTKNYGNMRLYTIYAVFVSNFIRIAHV